MQNPFVSVNTCLPVRVAIVEVLLDNGERYSERIAAVRGTPRNPMERGEIAAKAHDLIAPVLGSAQSKHLIAQTLTLERLERVRALSQLLQKSA